MPKLNLAGRLPLTGVKTFIRKRCGDLSLFLTLVFRLPTKVLLPVAHGGSDIVALEALTASLAEEGDAHSRSLSVLKAALAGETPEVHAAQVPRILAIDTNSGEETESREVGAEHQTIWTILFICNEMLRRVSRRNAHATHTQAH